MTAFFDKTLTILERALDVRLERQNVLGGNLANADTPGFHPRDVDFATAMNRALATPPEASDAEPAAAGAAELPLDVKPLTPTTPLTAAPATSPGIDGNAVDLDRTMTAMAENALQYGAAAKSAGKKLAILRYVASDGNA